VDEFELNILCHDNDTYRILKQLDLNELYLIHIEELEEAYPILKKLKKERSIIEYYFSTTPILPHYLLKTKKDIELITYLDADLFFYNNINPIYDELGNGSIYIIPHRFNLENKENGEKNGGKFNVGMVIFRNDSEGLSCLDTWKNQCIENCFLDEENFSSLGDQQYLHEWPNKYSDVVVSQNIGVGAGGWNILDYQFQKRNDIITIDGQILIMLHLNFIDILNKYFITGTPRWHLWKIYSPYIKALRVSINRVKMIDQSFQPNFSNISFIKMIYRLLRGGVIPISKSLKKFS
jgi:hypothetical protein